MNMGELARMRLVPVGTRQELPRLLGMGLGVTCQAEDGKEYWIAVPRERWELGLRDEFELNGRVVWDLDARWNVPTPFGGWLPDGLGSCGEALAWLARAADDPAEVLGADGRRPVVGLRAWRSVDGRLASLMFDGLFWGRVFVATCRKHPAPGSDCSCGVYAYGRCSAGALLHHLVSSYPVGLVGLTGRIVVSERGFRAERARPLLVVRRCVMRAPCAVTRDTTTGAMQTCDVRAAALSRMGVAARNLL